MGTRTPDPIGSTASPEIPDDIVALLVRADDVPEELLEVSIHDAQLAGLRAARFRLSESKLAKVDLTESRLSRLHATDVEFDGCNFSNAHMPDASFRRVAFSRCKFSGVEMPKATFVDVEFNDCRLDFASFDDVKFKHVTFAGCHIREADFVAIAFDHVAFLDCDLARATFGRTEIRRSEMRRCVLNGLRGLAALRGIAMEWNDILAHAEVFAAELGIDITGDEKEFRTGS